MCSANNTSSLEAKNTTDVAYDMRMHVNGDDGQIKTTYNVVIPVLGFMIIAMNLIIVLSSGLIMRRRLKPRSTYIFLGNVALADLMTGVTVIVGQYGPRNSDAMCYIEIGLIISATLTSVYSIGLIAIDRYFYILCGLFYNQYIRTNRARLMIITIWIFSTIIGFLPAMGVRSTVETKQCWLIVLVPKELLLSIVCIGLVPLVVIIILYGIILKSALGKIAEITKQNRATADVQKELPNGLRYFRGGSQNSSCTFDAPATTVADIGGQSEGDAEVPSNERKFSCCRWYRCKREIPSVYSPSRWKAIKIVLLTTGCYFVTWFPYFLACALYASCDVHHLSQFCFELRLAIASPLALLGLVNSLCNPIIYAWWHNGFRESAKSAYHDIWRRLRPAVFISPTAAAASSVTTSTTKQPVVGPIRVDELETQHGIDKYDYLTTNAKNQT